MYDKLIPRLAVSENWLPRCKRMSHRLRIFRFPPTHFCQFHKVVLVESVSPLSHQAASASLAAPRCSHRAYAQWHRYLLLSSASGYLTDGLRATRKPKSLERYVGSTESRNADRQIAASLTQPPPRTTRYVPPLGPCGSVAAPVR